MEGATALDRRPGRPYDAAISVLAANCVSSVDIVETSVECEASENAPRQRGRTRRRLLFLIYLTVCIVLDIGVGDRVDVRVTVRVSIDVRIHVSVGIAIGVPVSVGSHIRGSPTPQIERRDEIAPDQKGGKKSYVAETHHRSGPSADFLRILHETSPCRATRLWDLSDQLCTLGLSAFAKVSNPP